MPLLAAAAGALGLLLAACAGDGNVSDPARILHLGGGLDISEHDFREGFKSEFRSDPANASEFCWSLRGLDAEEAAELISEVRWPVDDGSVMADRVRASEIIQQECERFSTF
jgi:hypothetical protein